jgi:hypothetical protein
MEGWYMQDMDESEELRKDLKGWLELLPELRERLRIAAEQFPHDFQIQDHLKSATADVSFLLPAIKIALGRDEKDKSEDLIALKNTALLASQTMGFAIVLAEVKLSKKKAAEGLWNQLELLPIEGRTRTYLLECLKAIGLFSTFLIKLESNADFAEEVALVKQTAKNYAWELRGLLMFKGAAITCSRFIQLSEIFSSYNSFKAHALKNREAYVFEGRPELLTGNIQ